MTPLLSKGDIALCIKKKPKKRNKIVLYSPGNSDTLFLKRQIAIAGDTIAIKQGVIVINGSKLVDNEFAIDNYAFFSDSVNSISKYFVKNKLKTDLKKAQLGFFDCNLSKERIEEIKSTFLVSRIQKKSLEPKVRFLTSDFGKELYWNYDNLGTMIVPKKGMKIKLGRHSFILYKGIIEQETKEKVELTGHDIYIGGLKEDIYIFKKDYVFLVNDNRSNYIDSRSTGFVPKDCIKGTYLLKLFW